MACKIIITASYVATVAAALAFMGCVGAGGAMSDPDCMARNPDGSDACSAPVEHWNLSGTYCTADTTVCLTVTHKPGAYTGFYTLTTDNGRCTETGLLDGGLEFWPNQDSAPCLPNITQPGIYSASVDWSENGIDLYVSQSDGVLFLNLEER